MVYKPTRNEKYGNGGLSSYHTRSSQPNSPPVYLSSHRISVLASRAQIEANDGPGLTCVPVKRDFADREITRSRLIRSATDGQPARACVQHHLPFLSLFFKHDPFPTCRRDPYARILLFISPDFLPWACARYRGEPSRQGRYLSLELEPISNT